MKWNQICVAFLMGLLIGTVCGAPLFRRVLHRRWDRNQMHQRLIQKLSSKLKLSPEQKTQVTQILDTNRPKVDAVLAETRSKLEVLRKETGDGIKKVLSPEQQKKYDELEVEMKERMDRHFPPAPSPTHP